MHVSGKLPYTIAKQESDYPAQIDTDSSLFSNIQIPYNEGLFIDYRHFDAVSPQLPKQRSILMIVRAGIAPRYEFGFGLSYTTFTYSSLSISGTVTPGSPKTGYGASLDDE